VRSLSLPALLERSVQVYRDRPALIDGDTRLTYGEAIDRARRLAGALVSLGARPGDRIAVLDHNSAAYLEAYFACAWGGFTIVPLNFRLAPRELGEILAQAEPKALLLGPAFDLRSPVTTLDIGERERRMAGAEPAPAAPRGEEVLSAIYYTSGTTGEPKGVCLSERAVLAAITDALYALALQPDDAWLHAAPLFHLADACAIWALTLVGARHVLLQFEPLAFLHTVARERITKTSIPPTLINQVASVPQAGGTDFSSLRRISYGGSPMPDEVYARGKALFGCELLQAYGITETAGFVCCRLPGDGTATQRAVGWPVPNVRLRVQRDDGTEAAVGEPGELVVGGPKLMSGYWRKPEATAAVLREGGYTTGDVGYRDACGAHFVCDRKKDMIISGGENVYSVEVENALAAHPAVLEAAAFGVPDARWGEAVKAVVVLRPGANAGEAELVAWCRGRIGGYKVPKSITLSAEPLPKSGPGKIAKHLLRRIHG
jgi:long-chain acyl-CoA synthetase